MRNISFSLTTPQFLDGSKTVTRRLGWHGVAAGDVLGACEKCMGLGKGGSLRRLGRLRVIGARREALSRMISDPAYGQAEAIAEGFPHLTGAGFVAMFCAAMKCRQEEEITRIEFEKIP